VGKIAVKAVCRSVFLTTWRCILSAELTKMHSFRLFDDFAHWVTRPTSLPINFPSFDWEGKCWLHKSNYWHT